jgi:hypothetical protein
MKRKPKSTAGKVTEKQVVKKTDVLVSAADDHMGKLHEVENYLKAVGFHVAEVIAASGVITGSVVAAKFPALSKVPGVSAVEKSRTYQLAP